MIYSSESVGSTRQDVPQPSRSSIRTTVTTYSLHTPALGTIDILPYIHTSIHTYITYIRHGCVLDIGISFRHRQCAPYRHCLLQLPRARIAPPLRRSRSRACQGAPISVQAVRAQVLCAHRGQWRTRCHGCVPTRAQLILLRRLRRGLPLRAQCHRGREPCCEEQWKRRSRCAEKW